MLMLTDGAAEAIRALAAAPGMEGLRISSAGEQPAEGPLALQIGLVENPSDGDAVLDAGGAQVFLAPETVDVLDDKVLDADIEGQSVRFALLEQPDLANPNHGVARESDNNGDTA